jgi:hypothetical protein
MCLYVIQTLAKSLFLNNDGPTKTQAIVVAMSFLKSKFKVLRGGRIDYSRLDEMQKFLLFTVSDGGRK